MRTNSASKRSVKEGVELVVSLPNRLTKGSAIPARISLANNGSGTIFVHKKPKPWQDWNVGIVDADGKEAALTPDGRKLMGEAPNILTYGAVFMPMHSMETHTWLLDLSKCYDLKQGKYRLSVNGAISADKGFEIEVKGVEFEMLEEKRTESAKPTKKK